MTTPERIFEQASDLIRRVSSDSRERARRRRRRRRRALVKLAKTFALMMFAALLIVVAMMSTGLLFGPRGIEGLIAAPLAILSAWSAILYWAVRQSSVPRRLPSVADVAALPARTEEWLDQQRFTLPADAREPVDRLTLRLEALTTQVQGLDPQSPAAHEVRRLIGEELPELVAGYQKVPRALRGQPLHGGPSPDRQLVAGLGTIDSALARLHEQLADEDLRALATHQRYLESKYKRSGELE